MAATITRRLVSLADAADILAVSTTTARRYIANGHLDAVRLGRKTLRSLVSSTARSGSAGSGHSRLLRGL